MEGGTGMTSDRCRGFVFMLGRFAGAIRWGFMRHTPGTPSGLGAVGFVATTLRGVALVVVPAKRNHNRLWQTRVRIDSIDSHLAWRVNQIFARSIPFDVC